MTLAYPLLFVPLAGAAAAALIPSNRLRPWVLPLVGVLHLGLVAAELARRSAPGLGGWLVLDAPGKIVLGVLSVLFFFAGHGYHLDKEGRSGELLPWDVKLEGEVPIQASCIPLEDQVVKFLKASPARHKLVILDCCHSGDIFTQSPQAHRRLTATLRTDAGLFHTPAFQAIVSCRREQQASDGKGGHAPFTAALLSAFTVIPREANSRAADLVKPSRAALLDA